MTRWTAHVFINSHVGELTTQVEADTYEGARQQIIARHGQIEQIYGITQISEIGYASPHFLRQQALETQRQLSGISDELEYLNELEERSQVDQAQREVIEAWRELWEYLNENRVEEGQIPLSFGEMALMHGDPFQEYSRRMNERPRTNGKVNIECVNCSELITIPDMRAGRVRCPSCDEIFFADSTIPFDYNGNEKR